MKAPCKYCEKRYVGCHGRCEKYLEFKKANDERLKQKSFEVDADQYAIDNTMRIRRSWQRRLRR